MEHKKLIPNDLNNKVNMEFGLDFHETAVDYLEETYWYRGIFQDDQKVPMMEFDMVEGLPHIHCKMVAVLIWNYLSQFRRNRENFTCEFTSYKQEIQPY